MGVSFRKFLWIAIALMIVLCGVSLTAATSTDDYPCPYGNLKKAEVACTNACMMSEGFIDLHCYEYCIDEVCWHH